MSDKLKILYIASSGRSGSTVLDLLLGAHAACWTLGEFYVLPWELRTHTKPCGCGRPVEECHFWGPIVAEHQGALLQGSIDRFRDSYNGGRPIRFREYRFLGSSAAAHRQRRAHQLEQYGRDNVEVLDRVLQGAGAIKGDQVQWLVDASKSVYRLLWLRETGLFDVRVIHLVKDPRTFVHSICKGTAGTGRLWMLGKATLRWNIENHLFNRLFRAHFAEHEVYRLRYEELATDPKGILREISLWLGIAADDDLAANFRGENHAIAGNPSRFESSSIRLDEKWRGELWQGTQLMVRAATLPLAKRYGFR